MFEYIVYDLDKQRIIDFRLKAWADRFIVLRAVLHDWNEEKEKPEGDSSGFLVRVIRCPVGAFGAQNDTALEPVSAAVSRVLHRIHQIPQSANPTPSTKERNRIIFARFAAGESQAALARAFGISYQRVHQIIRQPKP